MKLPQKLGIAGTTISLAGIAIGWGIFPVLLKMQIGKIKGLVPGSETRDFWEKIPFPIDFKVYVFNVTNPVEVQTMGELPILKEIGPYQYLNWKEKAELIDYEEDDTVTFHMKNTYIFDKDKTAPLTGDEIVTIPHPLLVGLIMAVERDKAGVLGMVNKAIPIMFGKPDSIFVQVSVYDLLYGGIILNCTTKDFGASAICAVLKKESNDLETISPTVSKFSVFKLKNGTNDPNKFQVNRGILDYSRVGEVLKLNGKKRLPNWRGRPCNNLDGSDGTIFPPDVKAEEDLVSFSVELCRSLPAKYVRKSEYKSIPTLRFNVSLGDQSTEPSLKCFCMNDTMCLKKGVMDLMKCMGSPIIGSLPHFYDAHEDYQNGVKGLNPNEKDHSIYLDIEPMTGTPVFAKKRIQFSLPVHKVNKVDITKNLTTTLLPFIWVEESVELPDHLVAKIDAELFRILRAVDIIKWIMTILGAAIMSGGIGLFYKKQNETVISPTTSAKSNGSAVEYSADKKNQNGELGHTNFGYLH